MLTVRTYTVVSGDQLLYLATVEAGIWVAVLGRTAGILTLHVATVNVEIAECNVLTRHRIWADKFSAVGVVVVFASFFVIATSVARHVDEIQLADFDVVIPATCAGFVLGVDRTHSCVSFN